VGNEDDATAILLVFRGAAFRQQGFQDAAHEVLKEALRSRSRAAPIRHLALSERAENYIAQGKKAMARKDLERILAEDSDYEGVRDRLAELAQTGQRMTGEPLSRMRRCRRGKILRGLRDTA